MRTFDPIAVGLVPTGLAVRSAIPVRQRTLARLLVPDLALTAALVTLFYVFFLFGGPTALFRDADAGWHLRAGERMVASGRLLQTDPWSFSKPGASWLAWEWAPDIVTGEVHQTAGLAGVAAAYALAIALAVWLWFRLNWAAGGNFLLACLLASPMLSTVNLHWLARPHVFGWSLLLVAVWWCEQLPGRISMPSLAGAVALGTVWANTHGSFFLGPLVFLLYAAGAWLVPRVWGTDGNDPTIPLKLGLAVAAGTLVNPYGRDLHTHVLSYLSDSALLDRIGEFQSFNFHAEGAAQIIAALLLGVMGGVAALGTRNVARFLLAVVVTAGALRSARMLPVAALILLPLANGTITAALRKAEMASGLRRAMNEFLAYGDRLRVLDARCTGLAALPLAALLCWGATRLPAGFPADQFPVKAAASVAQLPAAARIFSSDKFGGYLIYRFAGERKVFFDGRSDFYGADFLKSYSRIVQVRPNWQKDFSRWNFTHALLPVDYSLIPALKAEGWTEMHRDSTAVLLASPLQGRRA